VEKDVNMFFTYNQNNSGGSFQIDDSVDAFVVIEADNYEQANDIAESKGIYFNGVDKDMDCECCGDRWHPMSGDNEGTTIPTLYGEPITKETLNDSWFKKDTIIYYKNGTIERIK
jgi:hypothetical protein